MKLTIATLLFVAALPVRAQMQDNQTPSLDCNHNDSNNSRTVSHCEIKEQTIAPTGRIRVDGHTNGGVSVKGWSRNDVLVREKIQTNAPTEAEAKSMVGQIAIATAGGNIKASAPDFGQNHGWSVSYEIFVPHRTDVNMKAHNGGVSVQDVQGDIEFETVNGGATLKRLAGNVRGKTVNGGLHVELTGDRWEGNGVDASTTNGGVQIVAPANYSARLETATVNGGISTDFPVTVNGKIDRSLNITLGSGGPLIRATTTNGGVSLKRKA
jgi:DUF4097 and DUF4098 domain-containing protein YvlB